MGLVYPRNARYSQAMFHVFFSSSSFFGCCAARWARCQRQAAWLPLPSSPVFGRHPSLPKHLLVQHPGSLVYDGYTMAIRWLPCQPPVPALLPKHAKASLHTTLFFFPFLPHGTRVPAWLLCCFLLGPSNSLPDILSLPFSILSIFPPKHSVSTDKLHVSQPRTHS